MSVATAEADSAAARGLALTWALLGCATASSAVGGCRAEVGWVVGVGGVGGVPLLEVLQLAVVEHLHAALGMGYGRVPASTGECHGPSWSEPPMRECGETERFGAKTLRAVLARNTLGDAP